MENEKMKSTGVFLLAICAVIFCVSGTVSAACPSMDMAGDDCRVDLADFAVFAEQWLTVYDDTDLALMASQWLTEGTYDITWVSVFEAGFTGDMSKYEITNAQFAYYLNAALASDDIIVSGDYVVGANGSNSGTDFLDQNYYLLTGPGYTDDGITNGGAGRINWTGSTFTVDAGFEDHPVTYVSWYGATAFAGYYGWRLPTELEWQAVADYDGTYSYGCGTEATHSMANYRGSTHPYGTTAVGTYGPFGYGMCDMAGNVWEWTNSTYGRVYFVIRGGAWGSTLNYCNVLYQDYDDPYGVSHGYGFRVCR